MLIIFLIYLILCSEAFYQRYPFFSQPGVGLTNRVPVRDSRARAPLINMQQFVFRELPLNQPLTPGIYTVWGDEKIKRHRCQVCVQAGRDGKTCKGKNNHKNCEFIEVCNICSLNYFSHSLLMDIDRHDCKKYNKYRASTLKILIVVALVVNKIVFCE